MLKTIIETLENKEMPLPVLSDNPTTDELQQLLENQGSADSGFFKEVYETKQNVVKLPSYAGALEGAEGQVDHIEDKNIGPETSIGFHDLTLNGYGPETPVVIQKKYDANILDLPVSEINRFLDGAIDTFDTALRNDIVLQDAKITNFGLFDEEVNYIDIADKESLISFNPPKDRSLEENRIFLRNTGHMYDAFVRSVSQHTDYSKEQAIHYITQHSPLLDESIDIDLPEHSLKTGLEQRLDYKGVETLESSY